MENNESYIVKCDNVEQTQEVIKSIDNTWKVSIHFPYVAFLDEFNHGLYTREEIYSQGRFKNVKILSFIEWRNIYLS